MAWHELDTIPRPWSHRAHPGTSVVCGPQTKVFEEVARPGVMNALQGYNSTIFAYGQTGSGKTYTMTGDLGTAPGSKALPGRGIVPRSLQLLYETIADRTDVTNYVVYCSYMEIYNEVGFDLLDKSLAGTVAKAAASKAASSGSRGGRSSRTMGSGGGGGSGSAGLHDGAFGSPGRRSKAGGGGGGGSGSSGSAAFDEIEKVQLLEGRDGSITIRNLSQHRADSEMEAMELLLLGDRNRHISETMMNDASSRSHCVFTVTIESRPVLGEVVKKSKLHFVDLAGSERTHKTGAQGSTLNEAKYINSSLHFLELVIISLQERQQRERRHVPYRNSMLTSVLRDSLGGNCKTAMIATIHAEQSQTEESISTCRFAQRVAKVENKAVVNEERNPYAVIKSLRAELEKLRRELAAAGLTPGSIAAGPDFSAGGGGAGLGGNWQANASTEALLTELLGRFRKTPRDVGRMHLLALRETAQQYSRSSSSSSSSSNSSISASSAAQTAVAMPSDGGTEIVLPADMSGSSSAGAPPLPAKLLVDCSLADPADAMTLSLIATLARQGAAELVAVTTVTSPSDFARPRPAAADGADSTEGGDAGAAVNANDGSVASAVALGEAAAAAAAAAAAGAGAGAGVSSTDVQLEDAAPAATASAGGGGSSSGGSSDDVADPGLSYAMCAKLLSVLGVDRRDSSSSSASADVATTYGDGDLAESVSNPTDAGGHSAPASAAGSAASSTPASAFSATVIGAQTADPSRRFEPSERELSRLKALKAAAEAFPSWTTYGYFR